MDNKKKRIMVISGLALAAVLITVIIAVEAVGSLTRKKVDTSEGVEIIKQAEAAEVTVIETKIQNLEEQIPAASRKNLPLRSLWGIPLRPDLQSTTS